MILLCCFYLTNQGVRHSRCTPAPLGTRNRQDKDIRAERQLVSAVLGSAVPRLSVFYSLVASLGVGER